MVAVRGQGQLAQVSVTRNCANTYFGSGASKAVIPRPRVRVHGHSDSQKRRNRLQLRWKWVNVPLRQWQVCI